MFMTMGTAHLTFAFEKVFTSPRWPRSSASRPARPTT